MVKFGGNFLNMKRVDLAYMAGIFDGEGSIWIGKQAVSRSGKPIYILQCALAMANPYIPKVFHFAFGGYFYVSREPSEKMQQIWRWSIKAGGAAAFLEIIKPYLRLKKQEADLAIQFQKRKRNGARKGEWGVKSRSEAERILLHSLKVKSND